jgi:hypothetical protein
MRTLQDTERVRVDAPTAAAALRLERRLAHLAPTAVSVESAWWVEIPDVDEDRVDEIVAAVQHWLDAEEIDETVLRLDHEARRIVRGGAR